jgi:hypothetical protein
MTAPGKCLLFLAFCAGLAAGGPGSAHGASVVLVPFDHVWSYDQSSNDLGTAWKDLDYQDSHWSTGPGPLAREPDDLPIEIGSELTFGPITHYFRAWFNFPSNLVGQNVTVTNLIDDGAVFYVNGMEARRVRMDPGPVTYDTFSNDDVGNAVFQTFTLSGFFTAGTNLLAVEVHQEDALSRDVVMGMALSVNMPDPIQITIEPVDRSASEHDASTFFVGITGSSPSVQWHKDGAPIAGATSQFYFIPHVIATDAGEYVAIITNTAGAVTSRVATLTVTNVDLTPPRLRDARAFTNDPLVRVTFDERLTLASATNAAHYSIRDHLGQQFAIVSAVLTNNTNVLLTTEPRRAGSACILTVSGVRDETGARNEIAPLSRVWINEEVLLVALDAFWRYDDTGTNHGAIWHSPEFNDDSWPSGPAILGFGEDSRFLPLPLLTILQYRCCIEPAVITFYFRRFFRSPDPGTLSGLRLRYLVDDGAVFYLNDSEIHRAHLPPGVITNATLATNSYEPHSIEGPIELSPVQLAVTDNLLAAEVHQASRASEDVLFAGELIAILRRAEPRLHVERDGDQLLISWQGEGFVLEWAETPDSSWTAVSTPVNSYLVSPAETVRFYRLRL